MNGKPKSRATMVTALAVIVVAAIGLLLYFHNWQQIVPITMATTSYQDITDTVDKKPYRVGDLLSQPYDCGSFMNKPCKH